MKKPVTLLLLLVMCLCSCSSSEPVSATLPEAATVSTEPSTPAPTEPETIDHLLTLVNSENKIPEGWKVNLVEISGGYKIDKRARKQLLKMLDDAYALGYNPVVCSAYRDENKQDSLYKEEVEKYIAEGFTRAQAKKKARHWVSVPDTSEHQLGLAVDIVSNSYWYLDTHQAEQPTQKWLMENSYKYGFILRYPKDKEKLTGVNFEPWHYRYVGKKHALKMYKEGLCLEEYVRE